MDRSCFLCLSPDCVDQCQECRSAYYCGEGHSRRHRDSSRRSSCFPFRVSFAPGKGRALVATRRIPAQELVLRDEPVCAGPSASVRFGATGAVACVECFSEVREDAERCGRCELPLCTVCLERRGLTFWHHGLECPRLVELRFTAAAQEEKLRRQISCLTAFRLLLRGPDSCGGVRLCRSSRLSEEDLVMARTLMEDFGPLWPYSEGEVLDALAILRCNAKSLDSAGNGNGVAVYPVFSLVNHGCAPNCKAVVGAAAVGRGGSIFSLELRATVDIAEGEEITVRYLPFTTEEPRRSLTLMERWEFECGCRMCLHDDQPSPAEGGEEALDEIAAMSAVKCLNQREDWCYSCNSTRYTSKCINRSEECDCKSRINNNNSNSNSNSNSNNNNNKKAEACCGYMTRVKSECGDTLWRCRSCAGTASSAKVFSLCRRLARNSSGVAKPRMRFAVCGRATCTTPQKEPVIYFRCIFLLCKRHFPRICVNVSKKFLL